MDMDSNSRPGTGVEEKEKEKSVSLCVVVIGLTEDSIVPEVSFTASKYRNKMASSKKNKSDGRGEIKLETAEDSKVKGKRVVRDLSVETYTKGDAIKEGDTKKINFFSGNPFVEVTQGILHLYKEDERTTLDEDKLDERSEMICMLAVPATINCRELLQFLAPFQESLEVIKIIRDSLPNKYMVLLKFENELGADLFYKTMHGVKYNSIEDEVCKLAYVAKVETLKESDGAGFPLLGHTELPICPVCLERMDESVDGILTILCNHTFHSGCLAKWSDVSCPVCRFLQTPELKAENQCALCGATESVWICLICGHCGCGRYIHGHAFKHFCETQHCYAIQPDNLRVWDYVGDNFVHRLLQNKTDGKLVEVSSVPNLDDTNCSEEASEEKVDSMQLEFSYLLTTQLEAQRAYFEDKLEEVQKDWVQQIEGLKLKVDQLAMDKIVLESKVDFLQKEKLSLEKKSLQLNQKLTKTVNDLEEEKELSKCFQNNLSKAKETEKEFEEYKVKKTAEIGELEEANRDLMFFLNAERVIGEQDESTQKEISEGQVIVQDAPQPSSSTKTKKDRKKK